MTKQKTNIVPVVKWVGGKRQLLPQLLERLPESFDTYCEPFIGGGALLLAVQPNKAIINDFNEELINVYLTVRDECPQLIEDLKRHKNESEYYYYIRGLDRDIETWQSLSNVQRASRFLYLNKTCYNGLYRVSSQGFMNTPFGRYKKPNICPTEDLTALSNYLQSNSVQIMCGDYRTAVESLSKGDFVYFDPPYDPISVTSAYTGYTSGGFTKDNQRELAETCRMLNERGVLFMLSNSATEFIKGLYEDFNIEIVKAKRAINCKGNGRSPVDEVIVRNYG